MRASKEVVRLAGGVLMLLGLTVCTGWLLQVPRAVQLQPDSVAMVFNTALSFLLAGLGLLAPVGSPSRVMRLRRAVAIALVLIATPMMVGTLLGVRLPVDLSLIHI